MRLTGSAAVSPVDLGIVARPRGSNAISPIDLRIVAGLLAVGVVLPAALAAWTHTFDIPRNDDWSYLRVWSHFVQTGKLSFVGWGVMTLVGQIFWAAPFALLFGTHPWVAGVAIGFASAIGIVAAYSIARRLLPRPWAVATVLLALAFPGFLLNTTSFMTDATAFSASMTSLAVGAAASRRWGHSRQALLAVSLAVGCFGFSIREFDLAAPVAVLVSMAAQDWRAWRRYAAPGVGLLVVCGAIYLWATHLPGAQPVGLSLPRGWNVRQVGQAYFTLCFGVLPLLPMAARRAVRELSARGVVLALVAAVAGADYLRGDGVFVGNYLSQEGALGSVVLKGGRPDLFPEPVWMLLQVLAVAGGVVVAVVLGNAGLGIARSLIKGGPYGMITLFTALTTAGLLAYGLLVSNEFIFDRHLWELVFSTGVLLACWYTRPRSAHAETPRSQFGWDKAVMTGLAGVTVLVCAAVTLNADAYDAARWSAGEKAVRAGVPSYSVDAGLEWVGMHSSGIAMPFRVVFGLPSYGTWYDQAFPSFNSCAVVSGSPLAGPLELLGEQDYKELDFVLTKRLYIYRVEGGGCGPSTSSSRVAHSNQLVQQGLAAEHAGNIDEAFADYQAAASIDPSNKLAPFDLGTIYQQHGDTSSAGVEYRKALLIDPTFVVALYNLGVLDSAMDPLRAINYFELELQAEPSDPSGNFDLGVLLVRHGDTAEGYHYLDKAVRLNPALRADIPAGLQLPQTAR